MKLWFCNFNSQLANALSIEGDYQGSISALECGYVCATEVCFPELQVCCQRLQITRKDMFFASLSALCH